MNNIIQAIKESSRVLLFPHIHPDGDALGSCFALCSSLRAAGKQADVLLEEEYPARFSFMDADYLIYDDVKQYTPDLCIAVDSSDTKRLGKRIAVFSGHTACIDHHTTNEYFANVNYVQERAATGEMIFELIQKMGLPLSKYEAEWLYTAISSDTGNFKYSNTTSQTHMIISELYRVGIDAYKINKHLYDTRNYSELLLTKQAIENIQFYQNKTVAVTYIPYSPDIDWEETGALSNLMSSITGVEVGIFIKEAEPKKYKFSLRSNLTADVAKIASFFGGGGHVRAAGFEVEDINLQETIEKVVEMI